jgi:hypothetical protein
VLGSTVRAEIDAGRDCHAGALEHVAAERAAVRGEARGVGVDEEAPGRHDRDAEPELAQCRDQEVAPRPELVAARLENAIVAGSKHASAACCDSVGGEM